VPGIARKEPPGPQLQALDPRAVKWCTLGAIQKVYPPCQWAEGTDRLLRALSFSEQGLAQMTQSDKACCVMEWNDDHRYSFPEARQVLFSCRYLRG
jgi:hypothetical protein